MMFHSSRFAPSDCGSDPAGWDGFSFEKSALSNIKVPSRYGSPYASAHRGPTREALVCAFHAHSRELVDQIRIESFKALTQREGSFAISTEVNECSNLSSIRFRVHLALAEGFKLGEMHLFARDYRAVIDGCSQSAPPNIVGLDKFLFTVYWQEGHAPRGYKGQDLKNLDWSGLISYLGKFK